jgi:hypothetical protein
MAGSESVIESKVERTPSNRDRRLRLILPLSAIAVAAIFLGHEPQRLSAAFGPSHEGFNTAVSMTGGRAIVDDGFVGSRLGAVSRTTAGDHVVYAHHPPLVYVASAAALIAPGSVETDARLPAIAASLVTLSLMTLLLFECGFHPVAAGIGLLTAFATPMFFVFGAMTEPLIIGLAPMTALVLFWERLRRGADAPLWAFGVVAGIGTVASWEAGLFAGVVAVALILGRHRTAGLAVLTGCAAGAILTGLSIVWAYHGDLGEFFDRAFLRAGGGAVRVGLRQAARQQMDYFGDVFPIGRWFAIFVAGFGLFDRRVRPLVAASLGTALAYAVLFRNGANDHPYWLFCVILPLALGAAAAADALGRLLGRNRISRGFGLALVVSLVVALGVTVWRPSSQQQQDRVGATIGAEARALRFPAEQRYAYFLAGSDSDTGTTDLLPWLFFYSRREPFGVDGPQAVPRGQVVLRFVGGHPRAEAGEGPAAP